VLDIARKYFNCSALAAVRRDGQRRPSVPTPARRLTGRARVGQLPLMGENQLGDASRGSHWETRIMADEFMSYGEGGAVSVRRCPPPTGCHVTLTAFVGRSKFKKVLDSAEPCLAPSSPFSKSQLSILNRYL
jgi:hypothetical protein